MELLESALTTSLFTDDGVISEQVKRDGRLLVMEQRLASAHACCPDCGNDATLVHSRYSRTLADLPLRDVAVQVRLKVRRFRCEQPLCQRKLFTERTGLAAPYQRRTRRLADALVRVGTALGGEAGARLSNPLGLPSSADTILRLVHNAPVATPSVPEVIGVDDWARRRGHTYGTMWWTWSDMCRLTCCPTGPPRR